MSQRLSLALDNATSSVHQSIKDTHTSNVSSPLQKDLLQSTDNTAPAVFPSTFRLLLSLSEKKSKSDILWKDLKGESVIKMCAKR